MRERILITGMTGFIGHHVAEAILKNTDAEVVGLDRCSQSGNFNRFKSMDDFSKFRSRIQTFWHDLRSPVSKQLANQIGGIDYVLHLAASSHVDRSISDPMSFAMDNVIGTVNLLEYCRHAEPSKVIYFSTDEVFGPAPEGVLYKEWDRYKSTNPYSASKAGGEEFAIAYHNTYKLPVMITHTMNVFGERQHPEKFVPMCIRRLLNEQEIQIHANSDLTKSGTRFYIHARNVASALLFLLEHGESGDKYNIVGEEEVSNLQLATLIAKYARCDLHSRMVDFHSSRPGHDLRYSLDGTKLQQMGFSYKLDFHASLEKTVDWTLKHREWLQV